VSQLDMHVTEEQFEEQQEGQYANLSEGQIVKFEEVKFENGEQYEQVYEQVRLLVSSFILTFLILILLSARKC